MFKINILPINESALVFQPKKQLSSFEILVSQLSRSTFDVPKYISRIFVFLTQVRPSGSSCRSLQALCHEGSALERFSFTREPDSNIEIILKSENKELSSLTKAVVSSAHWNSLNCSPPAPGRRKPLMSQVARILQAQTSIHKSREGATRHHPAAHLSEARLDLKENNWLILACILL